MRILTLALIGSLLGPVARAQVGSTCASTSDQYALQLRSYIRELVASTDTSEVSLRNSLGLKATDSTKVALVADNTVCAKVATGINTAQKVSGVIRRLYVVKVSTYAFAALDPDHASGEWHPTVTLDNKFVVKGVVLAQ